MIGRSLASVSTLASGRMCSSRSTTVSPFRPGTVTGTISSANRPGLGGGGRALVAADGVLVLLLAGDLVLGAQVLGGLDHAAGHRVVLCRRR